MAIVPFPTQDQAPEEPIVLTDENGEEVVFDYLDTVDRGDQHYIVLLPRDGDGETVTIMEMVEDPAAEDSYTFYPVESQKVLNSVFKTFRTQNNMD
jgi:uncharacterized protein YrzB (UPF0473 family)